MKSVKLILAAVALLVFSAAPAMAERALTTTVPFSFAVNTETVLPAGEYVISEINQIGSVWKVLNLDTNESVLLANGVPVVGMANDEPLLTFDCDTEVCALREIRMGYGINGYEIPLSHVRE